MRPTTAFAASALLLRRENESRVRGLDYTFIRQRSVAGTWLGVTISGFTEFDGSHPAITD